MIQPRGRLFPHDIAFQMSPRFTRRQRNPDCVRPGERNDHDIEMAALESRDRQADAVDATEPLARKAAQARAETPLSASGRRPRRASSDRADPVDVPLDEVAAEPAVGTHRPLEVHRLSGLHGAERRHARRLRADVRVRTRRAGSTRQAHAVHRHALAVGQIGSQRSESRSADRSRSGATRPTRPTASMRPVNIPFDQHIGTERSSTAARTAPRRERAPSSGTPPSPSEPRRDIELDVVHELLVPDAPHGAPRRPSITRLWTSRESARSAAARRRGGAMTVAPARSSAARAPGPRTAPASRQHHDRSRPPASRRRARARGVAAAGRRPPASAGARDRPRAPSAADRPRERSPSRRRSHPPSRTYCACRSAGDDVIGGALPGDRDAAVEAGRRLEDHERPARRGRGEETADSVAPPRRARRRRPPRCHCAQAREAPAAHLRERILHRRDDAPDAGGDDAFGARAGPAGVRARLERAVQRGAARAAPASSSAWTSACGSPAARARPVRRPRPRPRRCTRRRSGWASCGRGRGARARAPAASTRLRRLPLSWKSASTYSCGENGIRSSMPSPTPT